MTSFRVPRLGGVLCCVTIVGAAAPGVSSQSPAAKICPPCDAVASAQPSGAADLPAGALTDHSWAVARDRGVRAPWAPLERLPDGRLPGEGAIVAQIDTGVTAHPLLPADRVDLHAADDMFGAGSRNTDLLLSGFLRFPGHGTKTASTIVGSATVEMEQFGIAPGVHLVPIRATEGVVLFPGPLGGLKADGNVISRALYTIAAGPGPFLRVPRRVDVVSMSLGGWPETPGMCDAVKAATDAGVIVIIAAGNEVRRTTYPAKCPTAIAVAGSTYDDTVWKGSAGSAEVAIAAPAEGVWTAAVMNGEYCIEASSGTSFATALVAGLAAEWSVRHPLVEATKAQRYREFRDALQRTARPWADARWARNYGPGIVNAAELLPWQR